MKARLTKVYEDIRSSYWFVPCVMAGGAILLSQVTSAYESQSVNRWFGTQGWLHFNTAEGARSVLSVIASSMITVACVTFSMTIVAVSFASSQFGPRLVGNFMRDRGNQATLGTFIATFVYSLLTLRVVRDSKSSGSPTVDLPFVPHLSVLTAIVLAMASVAVFIYFIHHIPETINVSNITANVGRQLARSVERVLPSFAGNAYEPSESETNLDWEGAAPVPAETSAYIQAFDENRLLELATEHDLIVRVQCRPGEFVTCGDALVLVLSKPVAVPEQLLAKIRGCFAFGCERTAAQDVSFLADQLVEILGRALSPGVNDPFTAIACINWLESALKRLSETPEPSAYRAGEGGRLRLVLFPIGFAGMCDVVFDRAKPYVAADRNTCIHQMRSLYRLCAAIDRREYLEILRRKATDLASAAAEALPHASDRDEVSEWRARIEETIESRGSGSAALAPGGREEPERSTA